MEQSEQNLEELRKKASAFCANQDELTEGQAARYLSTGQASKYLGIPVETLKAWRGDGKGPPYRKLPNAKVDYRRDHLDLFNEQHTIEPSLGESIAEARRQVFVDPNARYRVKEASRFLRQSKQKTYKDIKAGLLRTCPDPANGLLYIPGAEIIRISSLQPAEQ